MTPTWQWLSAFGIIVVLTIGFTLLLRKLEARGRRRRETPGTLAYRVERATSSGIGRWIFLALSGLVLLYETWKLFRR